ncbi:hypothetical protein IWX85_003827 [Polaromonas sp. CG_9.11]|nr:hypothetical protein [Polaromonas sp. CG_9.11]
MVASLIAYASVAVSLQKNIGKPVEVLMQAMLHEIEDLDLVNTNLQTNNSAAIDLADAAKGVAIQVTTNASRAKWTKTFQTLQKNNMIGKLAGQYSEVRVIGFCKFSKPQKGKQPATGLLVEGFSSYLEKLPSLSLQKLDIIVTQLRASYDFSRLHPLHDEHCWEIVFRHLNRDAIRHPARFEGSPLMQAQAFQEVKSLIFGASVKGVKAKPLLNYFGAEYRSVLSDVDLALGQMLAKINGLLNFNAAALSLNDQKDFDAIRLEIIKKINSFNTSKKLMHLPKILPVI